MVKLYFGFIVCCFFCISATTVTKPTASFIAKKNNAKPIKLTWQMLAMVNIRERYSGYYKSYVSVPEFDGILKGLNKKEVYISGFLIPMSLDGKLYTLSENPYAACYFCGGAGPESVMTVKFKYNKKRYKMDSFVTLIGYLELNDKNVDELIYILNDAEVLQ